MSSHNTCTVNAMHILIKRVGGIVYHFAAAVTMRRRILKLQDSHNIKTIVGRPTSWPRGSVYEYMYSMCVYNDCLFISNLL